MVSFGGGVFNFFVRSNSFFGKFLAPASRQWACSGMIFLSMDESNTWPIYVISVAYGVFQADTREVVEALNSAIKMMEIIGVHVKSFMPKVP